MSNSTNIYHIKTDLEGKYVFINDYFKQKFGFIHSTFVGEQSIPSIFEGDRNLVIEAIQNLLTSKTNIESLEIRKPKQGGGFFWTYWEFTVEYDVQKIPIGIICIGFDITESKHLEFQNQNLLHLLNKSQEISATATCMYELATGIFKASHQLGVIFGVDLDSEHLLSICLAKIHPDDKPKFLELTLPEIKSAKEYYFILRIVDINFDNKIKYLETNFSYFENPVTGIEYIQGSIIDITKLRKKESDSTDLISHLNSILDNNQKSISVINRNFQLISFNKVSQKIAEVFNLSISIGDDILGNLPNEYKEKFKGYYERVFNGERITLHEAIMYPSGHFIDEIDYYPIFNNDNAVDFIVINCAFHYPQPTLLQKNASELSIAKSIIDYQETEKDRIATDLHDGVNQLLCAAKVHLSGLPPSAAKLNGVKLIDYALDEINQIIHNSSKFLLEYSSFENSVADYLALILNNSKTKYKWICTAESEQILTEDTKLQVFRIIQEIIQNVIKHANAALIKIKIKTSKTHILLGCSDNGKGFKLSEIKKGNGLDNILNRVSYLSGVIKIYSKVNLGTVIIIKIPIKNG